jgi:hypothetical protein
MPARTRSSTLKASTRKSKKNNRGWKSVSLRGVSKTGVRVTVTLPSTVSRALQAHVTSAQMSVEDDDRLFGGAVSGAEPSRFEKQTRKR